MVANGSRVGSRRNQLTNATTVAGPRDGRPPAACVAAIRPMTRSGLRARGAAGAGDRGGWPTGTNRGSCAAMPSLGSEGPGWSEPGPVQLGTKVGITKGAVRSTMATETVNQ